MESIGNRIKSLRFQSALFQKELAEKVSVTHQAVSQWELGHCLPDIMILVKISNLFDVSLDYIIKGKK